jgi:YjbE family integral membrane protein
MHAEIAALIQVLLIDITLAGDNALVVGMAVRGLPADKKHRAIILGIAFAAIIRIGFSLMAVRLLAIIGLTLAGGLLLLWVCWKMFREFLGAHIAVANGAVAHKTLRQAVAQIALADISMSLDNVLAVAGAARAHPQVLILGLILSVALMALASTLIAKILSRYHWIAWLGLAVVFYVAVHMIVAGTHDVTQSLVVQ